jgi:hypothetical protein
MRRVVRLNGVGGKDNLGDDRGMPADVRQFVAFGLLSDKRGAHRRTTCAVG